MSLIVELVNGRAIVLEADRWAVVTSGNLAIYSKNKYVAEINDTQWIAVTYNQPVEVTE